MKKVILFLIILVFIDSCSKEKRCDCLKSTGAVITEERTVTPFNQIKIEDKINLFLKQDTFYSVKVEAGENLLYDIITEVNDSMLEIRNNNHCNWVRSYKPEINVYVTFKNIWHLIYLKGAGKVITEDTIRTDSFRLDNLEGTGSLNFFINADETFFILHTGPADLTVKGKTNYSYLYTAGNGPTDMTEYNSKIVCITSKSTADSYVWVTDEIDVWIDYVGNIYYKGNPSVITHNYTGSGRLIPF